MRSCTLRGRERMALKDRMCKTRFQNPPPRAPSREEAGTPPDPDFLPGRGVGVGVGRSRQRRGRRGEGDVAAPREPGSRGRTPSAQRGGGLEATPTLRGRRGPHRRAGQAAASQPFHLVRPRGEARARAATGSPTRLGLSERRAGFLRPPAGQRSFKLDSWRRRREFPASTEEFPQL